MPIYEFYCSGCHTLFNFFSPRVDTETQPPCPRCEAPELERRPARFATLRRAAGDEGEDDPLARIMDDKLEGAMDALMSEVAELGDGAEDDPRQMAHLLRRLGETTGMEPGPKLQEYLSRMEAGEDPDALDAEMESAMDGLDDDEALAELFRLREAASQWRSRRRPDVDETLYFL